MKRLLSLLVLLSCSEDESARQASTCQLTRIEQRPTQEVSLWDELKYEGDKLSEAEYHTKQAWKNEWDYVETRKFVYSPERINIKIIRPSFEINGTFVLDSRGNLVEYSDDFFAHSYRYSYLDNTLSSYGSIKYVVRNGNIVERSDLATGRLIDRYTYDTHPNPIKGLFYEPIGNDVREYFRFYNANNILTETQYYLGGNVKRYTYDYGPSGLPIKQTLIGTDKVTTYTYKCN